MQTAISTDTWHALWIALVSTSAPASHSHATDLAASLQAIIVPMNLLTSAFLAAWLLAISRANLRNAPDFSTAARWVCMAWFWNVMYLLLELNDLVRILLPESVQGVVPLLRVTLGFLGSFTLMRGGLLLLPRFAYLPRHHVDTLPAIAILSFTLASPEMSSLVLWSNALYSAIALGILSYSMALYLRQRPFSAGFSQHLISYSLIVYGGLQLLYPFLFSSGLEASERVRLFGMAGGLTVKMAHLVGFIGYSVVSFRYYEDMGYRSATDSRFSKFVEETAHEILTPVSELHLRIDELQTAVASRGNVRLIAKAIDNIGLRISAILLGSNTLLRWGGVLPKEDRVSPTNMNVAIQIAVISVKSARKTRVKMRLEFARDPFVIAKPATLAQVFIAVLNNALDVFGQEPGEVRVITRRVKREMPDASAVEIEVRDNAGRLATGDCERVFERGYSTKGPGRGFGLSIAREATEEMGGKIKAFVQGGWTVFQLTFPFSDLRPEGWRRRRYDG